MRHIFKVLVIYALFPAITLANTLNGRVVGIADGDTITILLDDYQQVKVRLDSIDAPEKKQPFGNVSKQALSDLIYNRQVVIESSKIDRYGRTVGEVWRDGDLINLEMIKRGMAWVYRKYARNQTYYDAETIAKSNHLGLWLDKNPLPPWEFRHPELTKVQMPSSMPKGAACYGKKYCTQMSSCDEATYYLNECGASSLDKDGDGVPCESLCK